MVKIGIIGLGRISAKHISGIEAAGGAKIVAVCDIDEQKLKETGDMLGIQEEYRFTDYHDLVNCSEVEAVEICTPNYLHVPMATAAAKAGKHIQVEKPLGISKDDGIDELLEIVSAKKLVNMMDFSYRFKDAVRFAKHLIEQGKLGKLLNVNIEYLQSGVFIPGRRLEWRFVKEYAGSGTLADLGVHLIDMTRFLIGDFKTVCAMQATVVKERMKLDSDEYAPVKVDDITSFVAKLEGDVIANFMVTKCAIGERNTIKYELYGTDGVLKFNLNNPTEIDLCIGEVDKETGSLHTVNIPESYRLEEQDCFIRSINGEKLPYFPDLEEGKRAQIVVDAVLESAETGNVVHL